jgi:hypothetical protein
MRNHLVATARYIGVAAMTGFLMTGVLTWGAVAAAQRSAVVLVNAGESSCGAIAVCPNDPAPPDPDLGDQPTAEQRIIDGYIAKQKSCTPETPPNPQHVNWDAPGFTPNVGGTGNITDADPRLGGQFRADWVNGRWNVQYLYC